MTIPIGDRFNTQENAFLTTLRSINVGFDKAKGRGTAAAGGDFVRRNKEYAINKIAEKIHETLPSLESLDDRDKKGLISNLFTLEKHIGSFHNDSPQRKALLKEINEISVWLNSSDQKQKLP